MIIPYKLLFKFTTRSRPQKFFKCLDNIIDNLSDKDNYQILVSLDLDDNSMKNNNDIISKLTLDKYKKVTTYCGYSKNKIDAINRDIGKIPNWDILINFSDDMEFQEKGFDDIIRKVMSDYFPNTDGCLHFNDGFTSDKLITMSILGRKYYDKFGYIYHPDYISLFCDNEQTDVAKILKRYVYVNKVIFKHLHPNNIGTGIDEQYRHTESFYEVDKITYERHKSKGFDL